MPIIGESYYFYATKVVNDDFSAFEDNAISNFRMVSGYIKDPTSLKNVKVTNSFEFSC